MRGPAAPSSIEYVAPMVSEVRPLSERSAPPIVPTEVRLVVPAFASASSLRSNAVGHDAHVPPALFVAQPPDDVKARGPLPNLSLGPRVPPSASALGPVADAAPAARRPTAPDPRARSGSSALRALLTNLDARPEEERAPRGRVVRAAETSVEPPSRLRLLRWRLEAWMAGKRARVIALSALIVTACIVASAFILWRWGGR